MIENVLDIAAPAEKVFDFVVDVRNEPRWNRQDLSDEPGEAMRNLVEGHGGGGKIVVTV